MPLDFLFRWLAGLLAVALLGGGIYILHEWYERELIDRAWLILGWGMVLWSFVGFIPLTLLRRFGKNEPKQVRSSDTQRLTRPDGSEIHVEFYGSPSAPPLILIHGWGPNSTVWYYAKQQLADRFRLIVWDLPGLGKSTKPKNRDYSLEKYAHDLEAVLSLAEQPAILLGHSMGGMIILTFCRLFPEHLNQRVAGLVLVDTSYTNPLKTAILSRLLCALQKPVIEPLLYVTIALSPLLWLISGLSYLNGSMHLTTELSGFTGRETRGQLDFATRLGLMASPGVLARGALAMLRYDETATLPTIDVPVLVIVGQSDIATVLPAHQRMSADLPQAELVVLHPAGHMGLMERHTQFAEAVRSLIVPNLNGKSPSSDPGLL
ncbi:alpha/beta hydrolase [Leptolyngbya sp. FACHB-36]|uniref:alpha/beta fold hydrolase n=1 Tax=Leptolyngbya sp. FACHB-36 TaxID=2692808 RepID=UPI0016815436|nr:alpha/beta hydrolase [Leptolyngbya sp. FACHB-36]MBD2021577.1 alpha/beta hydrolase [Leptolyngbya sp. FACHB-36]